MKDILLAKLLNKTTFIKDTTLYNSSIFLISLVLSTSNTLLITGQSFLFPDVKDLKDRNVFVMVGSREKVGKGGHEEKGEDINDIAKNETVHDNTTKSETVHDTAKGEKEHDNTAKNEKEHDTASDKGHPNNPLNSPINTRAPAISNPNSKLKEIITRLNSFDFIFFFKTNLNSFEMLMIKKINDKLGKTIIFISNRENNIKESHELRVVRDVFYFMEFTFKIYGSKIISNEMREQ